MQTNGYIDIIGFIFRNIAIAWFIRHCYIQWGEYRQPLTPTAARLYPWLKRNRLLILLAFVAWTLSAVPPAMLIHCRITSCSYQPLLQNFATITGNFSGIFIASAIEIMRQVKNKLK